MTTARSIRVSWNGAGTKAGHKGADGALAVLEVANLADALLNDVFSGGA